MAFRVRQKEIRKNQLSALEIAILNADVPRIIIPTRDPRFQPPFQSQLNTSSNPPPTPLITTSNPSSTQPFKSTFKSQRHTIQPQPQPQRHAPVLHPTPKTLPPPLKTLQPKTLLVQPQPPPRQEQFKVGEETVIFDTELGIWKILPPS